MLRRLAIFTITLVFIFMAGVAPSWAQDDDGNVPVLIEVTGIINTITKAELVLTDGSAFKLNKATKMDAHLEAGLTVLVVAELDDEQFVAKSIMLTGNGEQGSTPDLDGNGKGKGKGGGGNGNGNGNNGKSNGGNGKDNDKSDKGGKDCLSNTANPVAKRLATALNVTVEEILIWKCQGFGYGEIGRAYLIARHSSLSVAKIFEMRKAGKGWGVIMREAGVTAKSLAKGNVLKSNEAKGKKD